jgi:hypothetical protein
MNNIIGFLKTMKAAYTLVAFGVAFPSITYPLTSLSNHALIMQVGFAKNGVVYEPSITDHTLNMFGLVRMPFGIILSVCIAIFFIGAARIIFLKRST